MKKVAFAIALLSHAAVSSAGECPLLVEPDPITANTPVTANWTDVLVAESLPEIEQSGTIISVDFNFQLPLGVLPPGFCGDNRALIGRLPPGRYTLIARGFGSTRSVDFVVAPVAIPTLTNTGSAIAAIVLLAIAALRLARRGRSNLHGSDHFRLEN